MLKHLTIAGGAVVSEETISDAKLAKMAAIVDAERQAEAAEDAARADLTTRRAQIVADLQAIRDATTLAAVRPPLLRTLRFILRTLKEQDDE